MRGCWPISLLQTNTQGPRVCEYGVLRRVLIRAAAATRRQVIVRLADCSLQVRILDLKFLLHTQHTTTTSTSSTSNKSSTREIRSPSTRLGTTDHKQPWSGLFLVRFPAPLVFCTEYLFRASLIVDLGSFCLSAPGWILFLSTNVICTACSTSLRLGLFYCFLSPPVSSISLPLFLPLRYSGFCTEYSARLSHSTREFARACRVCVLFSGATLNHSEVGKRTLSLRVSGETQGLHASIARRILFASTELIHGKDGPVSLTGRKLQRLNQHWTSHDESGLCAQKQQVVRISTDRHPFSLTEPAISLPITFLLSNNTCQLYGVQG